MRRTVRRFSCRSQGVTTERQSWLAHTPQSRSWWTPLPCSLTSPGTTSTCSTVVPTSRARIRGDVATHPTDSPHPKGWGLSCVVPTLCRHRTRGHGSRTVMGRSALSLPRRATFSSRVTVPEPRVARTRGVWVWARVGVGVGTHTWHVCVWHVGTWAHVGTCACVRGWACGCACVGVGVRACALACVGACACVRGHARARVGVCAWARAPTGAPPRTRGEDRAVMR